MVSKGFPNVTTSGRKYNFGEKPSVILYTYINLHSGTPKPQSFLSKSPGLQCSIGSERELYKYINNYQVFSSNKSKYGKIILVNVYTIFALPDYSSEVIERLQNLFYGRLIHLALDFNVH